ncbi:MAG: alpha/beta fold hydrolase [Pseudooceanicola sp.]
MTDTNQPGRLGDPARTLDADPRTLPGIVKTLKAFELDGEPRSFPVAWDSPLEDILAFTLENEARLNAFFVALGASLPPITGVARSTREIDGPDGNRITLHIAEPDGPAAPRPGIMYIHGGGMGILNASTAHYVRLRDSLAAAGLTVIAVEFRNAGGELGPHPYPAGLNDCSAALDWVHAHRAELGLEKLVVAGESGGGNLTMATAIKAGREGRIGAIDGLYVMCPFVSNAYAEGDPTLPSLEENRDYFVTRAGLSIYSRLYNPEEPLFREPLAWTLYASPEDLAPLPPTVISVNELDPLRDEGLALFGKLARAGVKVTGRQVPGTPHSGDLIFEAAAPEAFAATVRDIAGFARAL